MSTPDRPSRVRLSLPQAVFLLAVTVGMVGGVAFVNRPSGEPVGLLTDPDSAVQGGCFLNFIEGELVTDPETGTAIIGRNLGSTDERIPVMWPAGWTGRRTWFSNVEVLNPRGEVVVRTGTRVHLMGGFPGIRPDAWLACDMAYPL
jgi:hypothetical protein